MKKATLKDIAARAGVSVALVSNYLNRRPSARMSDDTRKRIDDAVAALDYHGSAIARSLRTGRSRIIGYVSEALRTEVAQNEMLAIFDAAAEENYQVFVAYSAARKQTLENIRMLKERGCDAIIVSGYFNETFSREICRSFNPVVILNTYPEIVMPDKILRYDYRAAVREAILHLQSLGHREIFYQTSLDGSHEQRYMEFTEFFGEEKVWQTRDENPTIEEWQDFIKHHSNCTALLHLNDFMAMRTIRHCRKLNIRIPEDMAVIGFDNIHAAECTTPSLSTISRPLADAAHCAVKALVAQLANETYSLPASLKCKFIIRESSAKTNQVSEPTIK